MPAVDPNSLPTQTFEWGSIKWQPMRLLALYNPAGAEKALAGLPDFRDEPAGTIPGWSRA